MGAATRQINVGGVKIGGGAPVTVQSMTNTKTSNARETAEQINRLAELGCDVARVAVPDAASADAIYEIKKHIGIPLVADVHFDHKLALRAIEAGADKLRINPGNIGGAEHVRAVAEACAARGIPIRIGVNSGSLPKEVLSEYGSATAEALCGCALGHIALLNRYDFDDICVSVKSPNVTTTIAAYKLLGERTSYPLHLGVTEAGTEYAGIVKSSVAIGALLDSGVGDTIRVSLTASPESEVKAGLTILRSLGLRAGYELISCPTCGRCGIDLIPIAEEVESRLAALGKNITVAVMGCSVNGPGEAAGADYGISGGMEEGLLFKKGVIVKKASMGSLVDELFSIIETDKGLL